MNDNTNRAAHTPGPWETSTLITDATNKEWTVCGPKGGDMIADLTYNTNAEADANRIVACVNACEGIADPSCVPDLLAALRALYEVTQSLPAKYPAGSFGQERDAALIAARAAIAKAGRP